MYSYLKFAKHTLFMVGLTAFGTIQSIIFLPIITKTLGAENYGIWTQIQITATLLVPITFMGLVQALSRFLPGEQDDKKVQEGVYSSLVIVFAATLVLAAFLLLFSAPAASFFKFSPVFIKILSLIIIFESLTTILLTVVLSKREVGRYVFFAGLKMFGETVLSITAIFLGYGLYGAVVALLLVKIAMFLILSVYVVRKIGVTLPNFSLAKRYLSFGLPTVTSGITYGAVTSADRYIIGFFFGVLFVGYYAPAYSLGMLLTFFIFPVMSVLTIVLPKYFDENNLAEVKNYLSYSFKYFLLIMTPAVFGISVLSYQLLTIFSTKEIATQAFLVVPFIAASMFAYGLICFFIQMLTLVKKTNIIAMIWAISAVVNIVLNIIFIPKFGIIAAAAITLLSYILALAMIWYFAFKEFQFDIDWKLLVKGILASVAMVLCIAWFNPIGLLMVIEAIILGVFVYTVIILLLRGVTDKEIKFFKNSLTIFKKT